MPARLKNTLTWDAGKKMELNMLVYDNYNIGYISVTEAGLPGYVLLSIP